MTQGLAFRLPKATGQISRKRACVRACAMTSPVQLAMAEQEQARSARAQLYARAGDSFCRK